MIESKVYQKLRTKKEYNLTEKGKHLVPVLVEMILWSARYDDSLAVPPEFLDQAKVDKEGMIARIRAKIE